MIDLEACGAFTVSGKIQFPPSTTTASCVSGKAGVAWFRADRLCNLTNVKNPPSGGSSKRLCIASDNVNVLLNSKDLDILFTGNVFYEGKGVIRAGKDNNPDPINNPTGRTITVERDLLPINGFFPKTNILGLVSNGDIEIGTRSQAEVATVAFAKNNARFNFQTLVLGAIVAGTFDITNQVPSIAHVPGVTKLTGMPGSDIAGPTGETFTVVEAYERR